MLTEKWCLKITIIITVICVSMLSSVHHRKTSHFHQPVKKRLYSCSIFCAASNCSLECFCESLSRRYRGSFCSLRTQQQQQQQHWESHLTHTHTLNQNNVRHPSLSNTANHYRDLQIRYRDYTECTHIIKTVTTSQLSYCFKAVLSCFMFFH